MIKFIKKNWHKLALFIYTFFIPIISFADGDTCPSGTICNPLEKSGITSIPILIQKILEGALKIGIPIVALAVIYSGFLFVFARGNSEKLGRAKDTLLYTLIGAAILLGSWAIAEMITNTITSLS